MDSKGKGDVYGGSDSMDRQLLRKLMQQQKQQQQQLDEARERITGLEMQMVDQQAKFLRLILELDRADSKGKGGKYGGSDDYIGKGKGSDYGGSKSYGSKG